jgi:hypothetical protein
VFGTAIAQASAGPRKFKLKRPSAGGLWPSPLRQWATISKRLPKLVEWQKLPAAFASDGLSPRWINGAQRSPRTRVRGQTGRAARELDGATSSEFTWRWLTTTVPPVAADGPHWHPRPLVGRIPMHKGGVQDSLASGGDFFNSLVTASFQAH